MSKRLVRPRYCPGPSFRAAVRCAAATGHLHVVAEMLLSRSERQPPVTQNSLPSTSAMTMRPSRYGCNTRAPRPIKRRTSASRSSAWRSMCTRFLTTFASGTRWNHSRGEAGALHEDRRIILRIVDTE